MYWYREPYIPPTYWTRRTLVEGHARRSSTRHSEENAVTRLVRRGKQQIGTLISALHPKRRKSTHIAASPTVTEVYNVSVGRASVHSTREPVGTASVHSVHTASQASPYQGSSGSRSSSSSHGGDTDLSSMHFSVPLPEHGAVHARETSPPHESSAFPTSFFPSGEAAPRPQSTHSDCTIRPTAPLHRRRATSGPSTSDTGHRGVDYNRAGSSETHLEEQGLSRFRRTTLTNGSTTGVDQLLAQFSEDISSEVWDTDFPGDDFEVNDEEDDPTERRQIISVNRIYSLFDYAPLRTTMSRPNGSPLISGLSALTIAQRHNESNKMNARARSRQSRGETESLEFSSVEGAQPGEDDENTFRRARFTSMTRPTSLHQPISVPQPVSALRAERVSTVTGSSASSASSDRTVKPKRHKQGDQSRHSTRSDTQSGAPHLPPTTLYTQTTGLGRHRSSSQPGSKTSTPKTMSSTLPGHLRTNSDSRVFPRPPDSIKPTRRKMSFRNRPRRNAFTGGQRHVTVHSNGWVETREDRQVQAAEARVLGWLERHPDGFSDDECESLNDRLATWESATGNEDTSTGATELLHELIMQSLDLAGSSVTSDSIFRPLHFRRPVSLMQNVSVIQRAQEEEHTSRQRTDPVPAQYTS